MRINDSKGSLENVRLIARSSAPRDLSNPVTGIFGVAALPAPLAEGQERLLFAIRTSFDRLFHPNRHWNQFPDVFCFEPHHSCYHFPNRSVANPFAAAHAAYRQALEKLKAARRPFESTRLEKFDGADFSQMRQSFALSQRGEILSLFVEAERLSHSSNPADRLLANQVRQKAIQLQQLIVQLIRRVRYQ